MPYADASTGALEPLWQDHNTRHARHNNAGLLCLFDSSTKKASCTNIAIGYSLLEVTGKRLGDEKALFNFPDGSRIWDFGDAAIVLY